MFIIFIVLLIVVIGNFPGKRLTVSRYVVSHWYRYILLRFPYERFIIFIDLGLVFYCLVVSLIAVLVRVLALVRGLACVVSRKESKEGYNETND